jgi:hypothetical protein
LFVAGAPRARPQYNPVLGETHFAVAAGGAAWLLVEQARDTRTLSQMGQAMLLCVRKC